MTDQPPDQGDPHIDINFDHSDGLGGVTLHLPAPADRVGQTMLALSRLGYVPSQDWRES